MIRSFNPYTGQELYQIPSLNALEIDEKINGAQLQFLKWRTTTFEERKTKMLKVADILIKNKKAYAKTMTLEVGKPIAQSIGEVEKCASVCRYYAENAERQLQKNTIEADAYKSYVSHEPLGVLLAIMPWNYPFWQVFRFAVPALMAGNVGLLKHAENVQLSAQHIVDIFTEAGFPEGCFSNLVVPVEAVKSIIEHKVVKGITLTGSVGAGSEVASLAGKAIKKTVLELGGSNALLVFDDCNLEKTVKVCVEARFRNTGQSCIAGKRLLVQKGVAEPFTAMFVDEVRKLKMGDPMNEETYIGTIARPDLAENLHRLVQQSIQQGAKVLLGGKCEGTLFEPTVLSNVKPDMPVFTEETFGPVIGITTFETEEEAVKLANNTDFGLGVSVFTKDLDKAQRLVPLFDDGAVFINAMVNSDVRLPFGGTKTSGHGRELASEGILEFVNHKTVYIQKF